MCKTFHAFWEKVDDFFSYTATAATMTVLFHAFWEKVDDFFSYALP